MIPRFGMIHGRFQPFHNGHWEYLELAEARCETLLIGITNPDPAQIAEESTSEHRHRAESNPFTYFERLRMIREALNDSSVDAGRVIIIPFPVNLPERWRFYVPRDVVHYVRVFSAWEQTKSIGCGTPATRRRSCSPGLRKRLRRQTCVECWIRAAIGNRWFPRASRACCEKFGTYMLSDRLWRGGDS